MRRAVPHRGGDDGVVRARAAAGRPGVEAEREGRPPGGVEAPPSSTAVIIGRFQPFHAMHLRMLRHALGLAERVVVVLGSHRRARSTRNPFSSEERERLIRACLTAEESARVRCVAVRDYLYGDNPWIVEVTRAVRQEALPGGITLVGFAKDRTSSYLQWFGDWRVEDIGAVSDLSATQLRDAWFEERPYPDGALPEPVAAWLDAERGSERFVALREEHAFLADYRAKWDAAPYAPTFVTTDAVVVQSGHVLVVRRVGLPGRGLWALPGGFVRPHERLVDAAVRQVREEAGLKVSAARLRDAIVDQRVFDHPDRSLRGRTITHAWCLHLRDPGLHDVATGRRTDRVRWMPLADLSLEEDTFFEDHVDIIRHFIAKF